MCTSAKNDDLRTWFLQLIDEFRESSTRQAAYSGTTPLTFDLRSPCQIEVFWLAGPEHQIVVLTRDPNRPDKEIIVDGPYEGRELITQLEEILQQPRWTKLIPSNKALPWRKSDTALTYAEKFEPILRKFLLKIKTGLYYSIISQEFAELEEISLDEYCWIVRGNAGDLNYKHVVDYFHLMNAHSIEVREQRMQLSEEEQEETEAPVQLKGYATSFFPSLWAGDRPPRTFRQRVVEDYTVPSRVFDSTLDGKKIVVHSDGFIGIECESKERAVRTFNILFGTFLLSNISCFGISEVDLAKIGIDAQSLHINVYKEPLVTLRTTSTSSLVKLSEYPDNRVISLADLEEILRRADTIIKENALSDQLVFYTEAYTHFFNSEFNQAFIIGWIIIERFISTIWRGLLVERGIAKEKNRFKRLTHKSVDTQLEFLNIYGVLNDEGLKRLKGLKTKRNNLVHHGTPIDKNTSKRLLQCAQIVLLMTEEGLRSDSF